MAEETAKPSTAMRFLGPSPGRVFTALGKVVNRGEIVPVDDPELVATLLETGQWELVQEGGD